MEQTEREEFEQDKQQIPQSHEGEVVEETQIRHRNKIVQKLTFDFDTYVYPKRFIDPLFLKERDTLTLHNGFELKKAVDTTNVAQINLDKVVEYTKGDERLPRDMILQKPTDRTDVHFTKDLTWKGLQLPKHEGLSIYPRVDYMARRIAKWINAGNFKTVTLVMLDTQRLLAPYMVLSKIIRYCGHLDNLHIVCSDSWYSYGIWGQYWFLKSDQKNLLT